MTSHVLRPKGGESVRHIATTREDRARNAKKFREDKEHQRKIKDERFAAIQERRDKSKRPGGSGGSGGGINITSDN